MDAQAAVDQIKEVLSNQSPEQIASDVNGMGGMVAYDYDRRIPFDRQPKGAQHPEFLMKDGPRESLDK